VRLSFFFLFPCQFLCIVSSLRFFEKKHHNPCPWIVVHTFAISTKIPCFAGFTFQMKYPKKASAYGKSFSGTLES
jgi:hypothetical protein